MNRKGRTSRFTRPLTVPQSVTVGEVLSISGVSMVLGGAVELCVRLKNSKMGSLGCDPEKPGVHDPEPHLMSLGIAGRECEDSYPISWDGIFPSLDPSRTSGWRAIALSLLVFGSFHRISRAMPHPWRSYSSGLKDM